MYQASTAFGNKIKEDGRHFRALIGIDGMDSITEIKSIRFFGGSNGEDDFSIGSTVCQYAEIQIGRSDLQIESKEFLLQIGIDINGTVEYIPMGYFTAKRPKIDEESTTVTADDRMMKLERPCSLSLPEDTTTLAVLRDISTITGVPVSTDGLSSISMARPDGYTCREVLGYVAQIYGGFAVCNRSGQIRITGYTDSGYRIEPNRYWNTFQHNVYAYVLEKLTCYTGKDEEGSDISISAGSGVRETAFSNPYMTQEVLTSVWQKIGGFTYMPGSLKFMGDPRIDPWDILTVADLNGTEYKVPVMTITHEFDGGLTTSVEAVGKTESEQESSYKGPLTKQMERYYAQLVIIDHAMVNKLDVDTARITYASIQNLDVLNERVVSLEGDMGSFRDLTAQNFTAANARINVLDTDYANIRTLLNGNMASGDITTIHLTSANTVMDSALIRSAVIQNVTAYDLLAGRISTDQVIIGSDDNGMLLTGSMIQLKDDSGNVRIQMGKDAFGDFTFILYGADGTGQLLTQDGLQASAISDGLIVDSMVAAADGDYKGIGAGKLDITSVIGSINSAGGLKSSSIRFDEGNQTLSQWYTQMNSEIITLGGDIQSARTAAESANEGLQKALDAISGIDILNALNVWLSNDSHVVHTDFDGSGGDYSECKTTVQLYLGDVNVSQNADDFSITPSAGVTGTWNQTTRTYQVTGMTTDNGYVDIGVQYGLSTVLMLFHGKLVTFNGKAVSIEANGVWLYKRFSISKSRDGKAGTTYKLQTSADNLSKAQDGTISPATVSVSALYHNGTTTMAYAGRYKIEETTDGSIYAQKYLSAAPEASKSYSPTNGIKGLRITLYDETGTQQLDSKNLLALADADELAGEIGTLSQSIQTTNMHVAQIETSVNGLLADISDTKSEIYGVSDRLDKTYLFQVPYTISGDNVLFTAKVYRSGEDIANTFDRTWFTWYRRTESGDEYLGNGHNIMVKRSDMGLGGVVIGVFTIYSTRILFFNNKLVLFNGKLISGQLDI